MKSFAKACFGEWFTRTSTTRMTNEFVLVCAHPKYEFSLLRRLSIVTLHAFAAERHTLCLRRNPFLQSACVCYRSIYFAHRAHSSKPVGGRCCFRWMEKKTDGQTDAEAFHRPWSAYADSVNKTALSENRSGRMIFYRAILCVPEIAATRRHILKLKYT